MMDEKSVAVLVLIMSVLMFAIGALVGYFLKMVEIKDREHLKHEIIKEIKDEESTRR